MEPEDLQDLKSLVLDDTVYATRLSRKYERRRPWKPANPKLVLAQIPGIVFAVDCLPGQRVRYGERLLVLEAMKMRNGVSAPADGTVRAVLVKPGQMVTKGQLLAEFE